MSKDRILFVTDTSGSYCEIEDLFISHDFQYKIINSSQIHLIKQVYDILILDRCSSIIPYKIYSTFKLALNTHPSLLPLHRGNYPIFWSSLFGDPLGITIHELDKRVDTGSRIFQERINYNENNNFRDLYLASRISILKGLSYVLNLYKNNTIIQYNNNQINDYHHLKSYSKNVIRKLPLGWDTSIKQARVLLRREINQYQESIEWQQNRQRLIHDILVS